MAVTREMVQHTAQLARLELDESRVAELVGQLNGILGHMDVLAGVDCEGVDPTAGVGDAALPLRMDEGPPIPLAQSIEHFAPSVRDGFLLVPRLATHEALGEEELA
jgi:aspartyl-tRNA(Asn)/glutamyl-tRNA(Gln) amidotransferase subunit C